MPKIELRSKFNYRSLVRQQFNYNHLYYFYLVVKLNGISRVAEALRLSQPTISIQIAQLEDQLGLKLFNRDKRRLRLTAEGEALFPYCRQAFEGLEEAARNIHGGSVKGSGAKFRVGVGLDLDRPFMAQVLSGPNRSVARKTFSYSLFSYDSANLSRMLGTNELDLVVTSGSKALQESRKIETFQLKMVVLAAPKLISNSKSLSLKSVFKDSSTPFVMSSKDTTIRRELDRYLIKRKATVKIAFESNIVAAVIRSCVLGEGITILPKPFVAEELKRGSLMMVPSEGLPNFPISILAPLGDSWRPMLAEREEVARIQEAIRVISHT